MQTIIWHYCFPESVIVSLLQTKSCCLTYYRESCMQQHVLFWTMSLLLCGSCTGCRSQREYSTSCACLCTRCLSDTLPITLPACWCPPLTFLHGRRCFRRVTDLVVPRTNRKIGDRAFSVAAPHAWNQLPSDLKLLRSTASFKSKLKSFLFHAAYTGNTVWTLECAIVWLQGAYYKSLLLLLLFTVLYSQFDWKILNCHCRPQELPGLDGARWLIGRMAFLTSSVRVLNYRSPVTYLNYNYTSKQAKKPSS